MKLSLESVMDLENDKQQLEEKLKKWDLTHCSRSRVHVINVERCLSGKTLK